MATAELGSSAFRNGLLGERLHADLSGTNSGDHDGPYRFTFVAYWHRQPG